MSHDLDWDFHEFFMGQRRELELKLKSDAILGESGASIVSSTGEVDKMKGNMSTCRLVEGEREEQISLISPNNNTNKGVGETEREREKRKVL